MFKSKSSRLASRRARQQQEEEEAEAARLAALPKQDYLDNCHRTYSCIHCRAHLANHDELLSKLFQGNYGRAYLFNRVVNIGCKRAITRELLTGLHAVCDIYCKTCDTVLGWKYETAFVASQKYKEGKFIIELVHMIKENSSDPSSFRMVKRLFHGASRQQVPAYEQVYLTPLSAAGGGGGDSLTHQQQHQRQVKSHKKNDTTGGASSCRRDRSSSSISIYRNGPSLANDSSGATRLRAPSMPACVAATCASRDEERATREHVAVEITTDPESQPPSAANDIQLRIANGDDSDDELNSPSVLPSFVAAKSAASATHRNHHQLMLSTSAHNLAPTGGSGGGGTAKGSSENSSQLSSSSASSNSLAIEHEEDRVVATSSSSDKS